MSGNYNTTNPSTQQQPGLYVPAFHSAVPFVSRCGCKIQAGTNPPSAYCYIREPSRCAIGVPSNYYWKTKWLNCNLGTDSVYLPPSPPPAPPSTPPGSPGATQAYIVSVQMVAAYDSVSLVTDSVKGSIAQTIATAASVPVSAVTITVTAGSVIITADIVTTPTTQASVTSTLTTQLATTAAANTFFASVTGLSITAAPSVVDKIVIASPPPSPPPVSSGGGDDGMSGGAIAGTVIGAISGPFFGLIGYATWKKKQQEKGQYGQAAGVQLQMGQQENV